MQKQSSLYTRIIVTLIVFSVVIMAAFTLGSLHYQREALREEIRETAHTVVRRASSILPSALWEYNDIYIRDYIDSLFMLPYVAFVRVRSEGEIYEKRGLEFSLYGTDFFRNSSDFHWEEQPIRRNGVPIGMFEIAVSFESLNELLMNKVQQFVLSMTVLIFGLAVITMFLFRRYIFKPIRALERVADAVARGDLSARSGVKGIGEIGRLAVSMDKMVEGLVRVTTSRDKLNQEIDKRLQAETELKVERDRIKLYLDTAGVALLALDRSGRISLLNRKGCELLGYEPGTVEGMDWFENFIPRRSSESVRAVFQSLMSGALKPFDHHENEVLTRDGHLRLFSWNNTLIKGGSGTILGSLSSGQDITEERLREQALKQSEERFRVLVESMNEAVVSLNKKGQLEYTNQRFCEMLGIARQRTFGKRIEDFLDPSNAKRFRIYFDMESAPRSEPHELIWTHHSGRQVHTYVSPALIYSNDGELEGATIAIADISKLKELEGQLVQAQMLESLGSMAAGIAHEINTPCQYVLNNTQFLRKATSIVLAVLKMYEELRLAVDNGGETRALVQELEDELAKQQIDYLQEDMTAAITESLEGIDRIAAIVRSVKQFANPGAEEKAATDLNELVRNTVIVSTNEWKYMADLIMELEEGLPMVPCVVGQINQVLLNLIVNAAQAIEPRVEAKDYLKGEIRIRTAHDEDWVYLEVSDNGSGIAPEDRDHVFRPFYTTKAPGKGTGQGLAISQTVIRDTHNGDLTFETVPGEGTTFKIVLPISA
ncbi:PAS domain S-box protein [Desulfovibrio ferrophilus]|uniref:histidine kinase n=1 Tax=Desulfovibrio ferrophilus TaxID=241368 RepID=A0A2Z6AW10_9BACT|nr:PAS domain S-box protein [Desulfovibrio ferrophilus]BBD07376.1 PAS/PAC sensor signal transduction histidine kinase [Desulfovibrio ferrophilus]